MSPAFKKDDRVQLKHQRDQMGIVAEEPRILAGQV